MKIALAALVFFFLSNFPAHAGCSKKDICAMLGKMTHFGILDKCPGAGALLAECKKVKETTIEDLPPAEFIDNGDGTITDTRSNLMWKQDDSYKEYGYGINWFEAHDYCELLNDKKFAGFDDWRLPSGEEAKSLFSFTQSNQDKDEAETHISELFDCW
jgi:hypothetical protein